MPWNKDGTRKESAFYLRSGNKSPLEFKMMGSSPMKQDEKEKTKTTKSDTAWTEVPGSRTTELIGIHPSDTATINSMRESMRRMSSGKSGKSKLQSLLDDE